MRVTVVGSGTVVPEPDRVCACFHVETSTARIAFDVGPGSLHHMARFDIEWQSLTHIAITHFHNDHIGDVPVLFFALKYGLPAPRTEPLTVIGPRGLRKLFKRFAAAFGTHTTEPNFSLELVELASGESWRISDAVRISACHTPHTENSLAYRLDASGASFAYTGDTAPSDAVADFLANASLLTIECSKPDEKPLAGHLTPNSLAAFLRRCDPQRVLITHVYPELDRTQLPELLQRAGWHGDATIAVDGLQLEL